MRALLTIIGLVVALFAWFNPLGLDMLARTALFILGFDMMGVIVKILIFWTNFAFPIFGEQFDTFSWTLLMLLLTEMVLVALAADRPYRLVIKPLVVFAAIFISFGLQPALAVAGIDLLVNLTHKIKRNGKAKPKKTKKKKTKSKDIKQQPKQAEVA